MRFLTAAFLTLAVFFNPIQQARAQSATDQSAALKTMMERMLDTQARTLKEKSGITLTRSGETTVEKDGDFYALTLPEITLIRPDANEVHIGIISINAAEAENPGQWKMSVALPKALSVKDENGTEGMSLSLGQQSTAMVWDERLNNATKFDGSYGNIQIRFPANNGTISIGSLKSRYDLDETGADLWSGPVNVSLQNAEWSLPLFKAQGAMADLQALINLDQYPKAAIFTNNTLVRLTKLMAPYIITRGKGLNAQIQLSGLSHQIDKAGAKWSDNIKIGKASSVLTYSKPLDSQTPKIQNNFKFDELALGNLSNDMQVFAPQYGQGIIDMEGAQMETLATLFTGGLGNLTKLSQSMQAGSTLHITNGKLGNTYYASDVTAAFQKNQSNALTGTANVKISGLDRVSAVTMNNANKAPLNAYGMFLRTIPPMLERFQSLSKTTGANGAPQVHEFDLVLGENGQFTLNGQPLNQLFIGAMPAAAPPPVVETTP